MVWATVGYSRVVDTGSVGDRLGYVGSVRSVEVGGGIVKGIRFGLVRAGLWWREMRGVMGGLGWAGDGWV